MYRRGSTGPCTAILAYMYYNIKKNNMVTVLTAKQGSLEWTVVPTSAHSIEATSTIASSPTKSSVSRCPTRRGRHAAFVPWPCCCSESCFKSCSSPGLRISAVRRDPTPAMETFGAPKRARPTPRTYMRSTGMELDLVNSLGTEGLRLAHIVVPDDGKAKLMLIKP